MYVNFGNIVKYVAKILLTLSMVTQRIHKSQVVNLIYYYAHS